MKPVDVMTETKISATLKSVAGFSVNPDNAPAWYVNIKSVEWKTPKPLAVGSQIAFVARFMGRKLSYVYEVANWVPGEILVMRTADGPFPMETTYYWEAIDEETTRMKLRNRGVPTGFSKLFTPFMVFMMKRANRKDLKKLKQILENKNEPVWQP
jgi:Polyketide cyclase / dehydrase and lipid transport